jgi:glycosyltransferase involved in cell wall biosynthesis
MKKKNNIYWIMNNFVDRKTSISPRLEMLRELKKKGYEVTIIATYKKKKLNLEIETKYLKIILIPLVSRLFFNLKCFVAFFNNMKIASNRTILIADQHSLYCALLLKLKYRLFNKKSLKVHFDIRTIPVEVNGIKSFIENILFWYPSLKLAFYFADSYSFISREIERIANYATKECCIWSSGVNIHKFKLNKKMANDNQLFYHGVVTANRGLRETIVAIDKIKNILQDIKFVIVGDGADLEALKLLVKKRKIESYIEFKGMVDYEDIQQYINNAKICICPLPDLFWWKVSSPLKVIEYLAMGKPCILTEINPHTKLLNKNTKGIYWAGKGTSDDIAKSIIDAFSDENNFLGYRKNLRKIAEENSWEKKACLLINYWNKIYI